MKNTDDIMAWLIIGVVIDSSNPTTNYHRTQPNIDVRKKKECFKCLAFGNGNSSKISLVSQICIAKTETTQTKRKYRIDISDTRLNVENKIIHNHRVRRSHRHKHRNNREIELSFEQVTWNMHRHRQRHRHRHTHKQTAQGDEIHIIFSLVKMIENST